MVYTQRILAKDCFENWTEIPAFSRVRKGPGKNSILSLLHPIFKGIDVVLLIRQKITPTYEKVTQFIKNLVLNLEH